MHENYKDEGICDGQLAYSKGSCYDVTRRFHKMNSMCLEEADRYKNACLMGQAHTVGKTNA